MVAKRPLTSVTSSGVVLSQSRWRIAVPSSSGPIITVRSDRIHRLRMGAWAATRVSGVSLGVFPQLPGHAETEDDCEGSSSGKAVGWGEGEGQELQHGDQEEIDVCEPRKLHREILGKKSEGCVLARRDLQVEGACR